MNSQRHSMVGIISADLLRYGKLPVILTIMILISALAVILVTHNTRLLTEQREQYTIERDKLNVDWRNLILEENVLADHNRISALAAKKLNMQYVQPDQERIVVKNSTLNSV